MVTDKQIAQQLMRESLVVGIHLNKLDALIERVKNERERSDVRVHVGAAMAAMAVLQLELPRRFPDLDPDRA